MTHTVTSTISNTTFLNRKCICCMYMGGRIKTQIGSFVELFIERSSIGGIGQNVYDSGVDLKRFSIMSPIPLSARFRKAKRPIAGT